MSEKEQDMVAKHQFMAPRAAKEKGFGFSWTVNFPSKDKPGNPQNLFTMFNQHGRATPAQWGEKLAEKAQLLGLNPEIPHSIKRDDKVVSVTWYFKTLAAREMFCVYSFGDVKKKGGFEDQLCPPGANTEMIEFGLDIMHETFQELHIKPQFKFGTDDSLTLLFDSRADYAAYLSYKEAMIDEIVKQWYFVKGGLPDPGRFDAADFENFRAARNDTQKLLGFDKGYNPVK